MRKVQMPSSRRRNEEEEVNKETVAQKGPIVQLCLCFYQLHALVIFIFGMPYQWLFNVVHGRIIMMMLLLSSGSSSPAYHHHHRNSLISNLQLDDDAEQLESSAHKMRNGIIRSLPECLSLSLTQPSSSSSLYFISQYIIIILLRREQWTVQDGIYPLPVDSLRVITGTGEEEVWEREN